MVLLIVGGMGLIPNKSAALNKLVVSARAGALTSALPPDASPNHSIVVLCVLVLYKKYKETFADDPLLGLLRARVAHVIHCDGQPRLVLRRRNRFVPPPSQDRRVLRCRGSLRRCPIQHDRAVHGEPSRVICNKHQPDVMQLNANYANW